MTHFCGFLRKLDRVPSHCRSGAGKARLPNNDHAAREAIDLMGTRMDRMAPMDLRAADEWPGRSLCSVAFAVMLLAPRVGSAWPAPLLVAGGATAPTKNFPIPDELVPAVQFWTEIFTRHDSTRIILHDRRDLNVIWQVIELPLGEDGAVDEKAANRKVKEITNDLKKRLRRLERDPAPTDDEDRVILALAGEKDPARLKGAWTRVRAQRGVADRFRDGLVRARKWLPSIRDVLVDEGVPVELTALPFVESMFNQGARSSAGAAGIWQLMPATARGLGLTVKRGNDERYDIAKSTRAAAKMLRQNHTMLGNWPLAITAYNHGPYGLKRAVKSVGSADLVYLIQHYEKSTWGFASKNFYAEFLAARRIFAEQEETFAAVIAPNAEPMASKVD